MELSELHILIGDLLNDPNHELYTLAQINTELDNSQDKWNVEAKIVTDSTTVAMTDSDSGSISLPLTENTPIQVTRVTWEGLKLKKVNKSYLDLYSGEDWTLRRGTPIYWYFVSSPSVEQPKIWPMPNASGTAGIEWVVRHTPMVSSTDSPFMLTSNVFSQMVPYHWGLAYDVASRLLIRYPSETNIAKVIPYKRIADEVFQNVITVFKALEKEEPMRLRSNYVPVGGSNW